MTVVKKRNSKLYTGENMDALNGETSPVKLAPFTKVKHLSKRVSICKRKKNNTEKKN